MAQAEIIAIINLRPVPQGLGRASCQWHVGVIRRSGVAQAHEAAGKRSRSLPITRHPRALRAEHLRTRLSPSACLGTVGGYATLSRRPHP